MHIAGHSLPNYTSKKYTGLSIELPIGPGLSGGCGAGVGKGHTPALLSRPEKSPGFVYFLTNQQTDSDQGLCWRCLRISNEEYPHCLVIVCKIVGII